MKIKDSALVAAAQLANRYITDRFLPDKAIDLMDEATARLAMELQSVPTEIDEVERRLMQLELAYRQLEDETEEHAVEQRAEIKEEMEELKHKAASLREQWEAEKLGVGDVKKLRADLDAAEREFEQLNDDIMKRRSAGQWVENQEYHQLADLDKKRKKIAEQLEKAGTVKEAAANSGELILTMSITNLSAVNPLVISLFHGADFDVNGTAAGDTTTLQAANTYLRVVDATAGFAEYRAFAPVANAFLIRPFAAATDVFGLLGDALVTNFDNTTLPSTNIDFTGAFQWDLTIPPSGTASVSVALNGNGGVTTPVELESFSVE